MTTALSVFSLELDLPQRPSLSVDANTLEHGQVRYAVHGPHVRGTFIVVPVTGYGRPLGARDVVVHFGDGPGPVRPYTARPNEPVVNGVPIHGATEVIDPHKLHAQPYFLASRAVVLVDDLVTRRIPDGARAVTEAVVTALVRHWQHRPDRDALIAAAVRNRAADHLAHERREIASLQAELAAVRTEHAAVRRRGWRYDGSGDVRSAEPPTRGPGPTAERAGAILRAVAVHFLARPDLSALQISAGKQAAARRRTAATEELGRLRAREARLRRRLRTHQAGKSTSPPSSQLSNPARAPMLPDQRPT
ncbi:hypothetical protein ACFCY8_40985 [Streptomyces noursei]|uniref:hypothetical protein n=1 Tax=Streptomyces noursei TaxID=1971 RepID=UPI0035DE462B